MIELKNLTLKKFIEGVKKRQFTVKEVVSSYIDRINEKDKDINGYIDVYSTESILKANEIDSNILELENNFASLLGAPLAIKDNILIKGKRATAGSKILENYIASYDATVIENLKFRDAIILGKTNMDEFAMGSSTENSAFFKTKNPHDFTRVPGGSSGGSAAAVSYDLALAALGSDTGGSIREPASFCGVVGLKPTYGTVSRNGLIAMASSLDQIGPITKTVSDAVIMFEGIISNDRLDATSVKYPKKQYEFNLERAKNIKIGLPKEFFEQGLDESVREAVQSAIISLEELGVNFIPISLPYVKTSLSTYYILMPAEVSSNLARFDGVRYGKEISINNRDSLNNLYFKTRRDGFGVEVKRRIILGTYILSSGYYDAYYLKALNARKLIQADFEEAFKKVDVIFSPTVPTKAFKLGEKTDPISMYLSDIYTIPANLTGMPAISIPIKNLETLPIGFQLMAPHMEEERLFDIGLLYENI